MRKLRQDNNLPKVSQEDSGRAGDLGSDGVEFYVLYNIVL